MRVFAHELIRRACKSAGLVFFVLALTQSVILAQVIDRSSMTNKVMVGYQGWHMCPGDGNDPTVGWNHWSESNNTIGPGNYHTEIWPDVTEYNSSDLFLVPNTTLTSGGTPYLYSDFRQGATNTHFRWMQENGIDGAFVQRFLCRAVGNPNDPYQKLTDQALQNEISAANKYGRVICLEYDISGVVESNLYNQIVTDWNYLNNTFNLKNNARYLNQNGKPVVVIWGFGFSDRPGTPTLAQQVLDWFKANGCFVMAGVPGNWRSMSTWLPTYRNFNGITPWTVGAYTTSTQINNYKTNTVAPDVTYCSSNGLLYMTTAWPRFGWDNMNHTTCGSSHISSRGGQHFWDQIYRWKQAGVTCQFIAMMDEYDESTAIMKLTDNVPTGACWFNTEGKGNDWWLRLANQASKMQRGEITLSSTIPIVSTTSPDNAQIISDTIPTSMVGSRHYDVSITVKNTGETTWNAEFFKLGTLEDSDPFYGTNRVQMATGDVILPNQQKTFAFTMVAPAAPGTYTTDWQMVHELIRWFGGTLTKQVQVTAGLTPPGPVTAFAASATADSAALSWHNPSEAGFTGTMIRCGMNGYPTDPNDGSLVIDRLAAPGSNDNYVHSGLMTGATYYYRAFSHDAYSNYNDTTSVTASVTTDSPTLWLRETFDAYANANLGGQGNWTTVDAQSQVQSTFISGAAGKAILLDGIAAAGQITNSYSGFAKKASGTQAVSFDAAQSWAGTLVTTAFGTVSFLADDSTEIARFICAANKWELEYASGSITILNSSVTQNVYQTVKIVFDMSQRKMTAYVNGTLKASNLSFKTGSGSNLARITVSSNPVPELTTQKFYVDNIIGETYPAVPASVTDDGAYTGSLSKLHCSWTSGGPSAIEYKYAIGTMAGGTQLVGWTTVGPAMEITRDDLVLAENRTYYFAVQSGNGLGTWSSSANSNGIKTPATAVTIQQAKGLQDGVVATDTKAIRGKVVSATFPGYFYIQEPNGYFGLRAVSTASVSPGASVDLAGLMKGAGAERYLDCTGNAIGVTTPSPLELAYPVCMRNDSAGGVALNAYAPGVSGGVAPNNVGLLVTVSGRVTQRDTVGTAYFYIDDGCGLRDGTATGGVENVGLRIVANPSGHAPGSYVAVKGVVSCFGSSGLRPQILAVTVQTL